MCVRVRDGDDEAIQKTGWHSKLGRKLGGKRRNKERGQDNKKKNEIEKDKTKSQVGDKLY